VETIQLLGSTIGIGFVAGIRLYATILVLGLTMRMGWLHLPAGLEQHAALLTNPFVLAAAAIAYVCEFFSDKIPWVDSFWDSFHTFIRPLGAAVIAASALGNIDPTLKFVLIVLCGGVALASHSSKAATRLVVNHSPEPFTNIALSVAGDVLAPAGVWLSLQHPRVVLILVSLFLLAFAWLSPKVFRITRLELVALSAWLNKRPPREVTDRQVSRTAPKVLNALISAASVSLPDDYVRALSRSAPTAKATGGLRCAAAGTNLLNSIGYLVLTGDRVTFITRRMFRFREQVFDNVKDVAVKRGVLMNKLDLTEAGDKVVTFYLFKDVDVSDFVTTMRPRWAAWTSSG
jgi:Domain of unknown function (DUF4126)